MDSLKSYLQKARDSQAALGHFNVSTLETFHAIVDACRQTQLPVIVGVSEGEAQFFGIEDAAALVRRVRDQEKLPVFLNADHFHDMALIERAARAGFDALLCDFGRLPFSENCEKTKHATDTARKINRHILIEGELGYLGSGSEIHQEIPEGAQIWDNDLTTPDQAQRFQKQTHVDLLAPAVGTFHGMTLGGHEHISAPHIEVLRKSTDMFLVLHGGSGLPDAEFVSAIQAGVSVIHINTELRSLWRQNLEQSLAEQKNEVAPYKLLTSAKQELQKHIAQRMRLFGGQK